MTQLLSPVYCSVTPPLQFPTALTATLQYGIQASTERPRPFLGKYIKKKSQVSSQKVTTVSTCTQKKKLLEASRRVVRRHVHFWPGWSSINLPITWHYNPLLAQMPLPHHHKTQNIRYMTKNTAIMYVATLPTLGSKNAKQKRVSSVTFCSSVYSVPIPLQRFSPCIRILICI